MKTLSHSGLRLWRNCPRQYFFAYGLLRRTRAIAPALAFGSLWDRALTAWHHGTTDEERLLAGVEVLQADPDPIARAKAEALLVGYTVKWGGEPIEVVATQVDFTVPILHPETGLAHPDYQYTGVLDAVIRHRGRLLGLESKTSSEDTAPGSPFWQRIATLDPQVTMYLSGAKQAGFELEAVLYDVTRKPELRLGKTESPETFRERIARDVQGRPDWYFQRHEIVRLDSESKAYAQDLWDYATTLSEAERANRFPRNPDRCRQFGRPCEYIGVCAGEASIQDPVLFRDAERGKPNVTARTNPTRTAA